MRQIVLDTETTGLETRDGHRLIEIGAVEVINRRLTDNRYHQYINPEREIDPDAIAVHGISNEQVADKPVFAEVAQEFWDFICGAELVIHNAPFDVGFIDYELTLLREKDTSLDFGPVAEHCSVLDTLAMARGMHPGQRNNLDALCKRYAIDNGHRVLHGALLDAEILAEVYLAMTGGQTALTLDSGSEDESVDTPPGEFSLRRLTPQPGRLRVVHPTDDEWQAHLGRLAKIRDKAGVCQWDRIAASADQTGGQR